MDCGSTETKSGQPCKRDRPSDWHFACTQHATEDEKRYGDHAEAAYEQGVRDGSGADHSDRISSLEAELKTAHDDVEKARKAATEAASSAKTSASAGEPDRRTEDPRGGQIVTIAGRPYVWRGEGKLAVGDSVVVEDASGGHSTVTVDELGTAAPRSLRPIVGRA